MLRQQHSADKPRPLKVRNMSETQKHATTSAPIGTLQSMPSRRAMFVGSGALLAGVTGFLAAPGAGTAAANPDAALIQLCDGHIANIAAYNADASDLDHHENPLWDVYERSSVAISAMVPQTLAGLVAKARVAKAEAVQPDGKENWESSVASNWAWDIVNDLIRMAEVQA